MSTEGDNKALDLGAVRDNLPAHYLDCDRFEVYNYGLRQGQCDCVATRDFRALIAAVERLTVERDSARELAVALEQQTAEALRIARLPLDGYEGERNDDLPFPLRALRRIERILGAFPDDEITDADWRGRYCTGGCGHMERLRHDGRCDGLDEDNGRCDCDELRVLPDDETAVNQ